jgi:hypothetical protein
LDKKAKFILLVSLASACASGTAFATCGVTPSSYAALQMMMTYSDVVKMLGCEGEHIFEEKNPGMVSSTYMCDGAVPRSTITLVFGNGMLRGRSNYNLN